MWPDGWEDWTEGPGTGCHPGFCFCELWEPGQMLNDKLQFSEVPFMAQLVSMRMWVWSLPSLSGLRIHGVAMSQCRLQIWLESHVVVAVAGSYSSSWTPSLETPTCCRCGPKKREKKKKNAKRTKTPAIFSFLHQVKWWTWKLSEKDRLFR